MSEQKKELTDEEFEQMLADEQHKELVGLVRELIRSNRKEDSSVRISQALEKNGSALLKVLDRIEALTVKPDSNNSKQEIKVNTNQELVVRELQALSTEMKNSFSQLIAELVELKMNDNKPVSWKFDFKRDIHTQYIQSVIANPVYE